MTDQQLNEAVWEFRGWNPKGEHWQEVNGIWTTREKLPNHIAGIEALGHVHEAEQRMTDVDRARYISGLALILSDDFYERKTHWSPITAFATARQRVIALLRVVKPELFQ